MLKFNPYSTVNKKCSKDYILILRVSICLLVPPLPHLKIHLETKI